MFKLFRVCLSPWVVKYYIDLLYTSSKVLRQNDQELMLGGMGNSILVFDMIVISRYTGICMLPLHGCLEEALPVFV